MIKRILYCTTFVLLFLSAISIEFWVELPDMKMVAYMGHVLALMFLVPWGILDHTLKYPQGDEDNYTNFDVDKAIKQIEDKYYIEFREVEKGLWVCEESNTTLDLRGCICPKSVIRSYVVRNIRYPYISKKDGLYKLFKLTYAPENIKYPNITLVLISESKRYEKAIVKNGKTRLDFFSREITRMPYIEYFSGKYGGLREGELKAVCEIDENYYLQARRHPYQILFVLVAISAIFISIVCIVSCINKMCG